MSLETATCPGCDHTFSLRGYHSHLALSRDPLCHAIFDKLKKAHDAYELLMNSGVGSDTDAATSFQGDAFRTTEDYASNTFGQAMNDNKVEPDNLPPLMEVSDNEDDDEEDDNEEESEMAAMVAELKKSWELPREGAPHQDAMANNEVDHDEVPPLMDVSDDEDNEEGGPHQEVDDLDVDDDKGHAQHARNTDWFIIRDGYGVKPAVRIQYNDKYPSARAGQPLTHQESRDNIYGAALGGGDNPWAPFNSKKDWESARWEKLWGAGSTAFSELLAINGICFNWLFLDYIFMFIHVYLTGPWSPQFVIQKFRGTESNYQY